MKTCNLQAYSSEGFVYLMGGEFVHEVYGMNLEWKQSSSGLTWK